MQILLRLIFSNLSSFRIEKNKFLYLLGLFSIAVSCGETVRSNAKMNKDVITELQVLYDRSSFFALRDHAVVYDEFLYDICFPLDAVGMSDFYTAWKNAPRTPRIHDAIVTTDSATVAPFLYALRNAHQEPMEHPSWDYVDTWFVAILKKADHSDTLAFAKWPIWRIQHGDSTFIDRDLCHHLYRTVFARDTAWLKDIKSSWLYRCDVVDPELRDILESL